jgi:hypothetical protein
MLWVFLLFISSVLGDSKVCAPNCTIVGNATKDECVYYKHNEDWLPTSYARSAACACKGVPGNHLVLAFYLPWPGMWDEGWSSPSSACVRNFLLAAHVAVNDTFKDQMRKLKADLCNDVSYCVTPIHSSRCFVIPNILYGWKKIGFLLPTRSMWELTAIVVALLALPPIGPGKR